jgi:hypothetical protein
MPESGEGQQSQPGELNSSANAELAQELSASREQLVPSGVEFKFAFCSHHGQEQGLKVAESLRDCEIVAFEAVGQDAETRAKRAEEYTSLVTDPDPDPAKLPQHDEFTRTLLTELGKTGTKQIVLIDISSEHPEYALRDQTREKRKAFSAKTIKLEAPESIRQALREYLAVEGRRDASREATQVDQLKQLAATKASSSPPVNIGVVVGISHTSVQHELSRQNYKTTRSFIDDGAPESQPPVKHLYGHMLQAIRQAAINPTKEIGEGLLNRVILDDIFATSGALLETGVELNDATFNQIEQSAYDAVSNMSDDEVSGLLEKLHQLRKSTDYENDPDIIEDELRANYARYKN